MPIKEDRINVRLSAEQGALIRSAAEIEGMTLTDFAVESMKLHARHVLADRRLFRISDEAWDAFDAMLERPPVHKSRLQRLLDEPDE